ncbi:MAG: hypothetical protein DBX55_08465 [Verrucomicrobia bacterium]|nr:MAG: hypothetical protein DBX55_08465 [Verrucomicrobiota bacterium]
MKSLIAALPAFAALLTAACTAAEDVRDDARKTPIGSVFTGETRTADSYIKRVESENKKLDRDTWRPQSPDRF